MKNFDFLKDTANFADLYGYCNSAEVNQLADPEKSALSSRKALEYTVRLIYNIKGLSIPERSSLFELVEGESFKSFINDAKLMMALHYIRKVGNAAAHTGKVTKKESFFCVLNLHTFVAAVLTKLEVVEAVPLFNKDFLQSKSEPHVLPQAMPKSEAEPLVSLQGKLSEKDTLLAKLPEYFTEAETRRYYIDQLLSEAGWELLEHPGAIVAAKAGIEIMLEGMPNSEGIGFADYVLFGRDGTPLAVVEAKKTSVDPIKGSHQAALYADCLEKKYGVRPIIYYTNGYEIKMVDELGYPPRRVFGFHTLAELELYIQRKDRGKITDLKISDKITNRYYQKQAITAVCDHFNSMHRRALLVMATGTGKTRVSISLVDVLMRNQWVKNVLFLADRTGLVRQAKRNFTKLLPSATVCVLSDGGSKPDLNARVMFSTYQTMINYIDSEEKDFSIGRFDLIIIDEAHRSIFNKYASIFDYFDAMLVGLTATPREEVARSTYDVFEMEQGVPNFSYDLETAVADHFLVKYRGFSRESNVIKRGIKYANLSNEEKDQLEKVWDYEAATQEETVDPQPRDIESVEIFKYIFNVDTIDKVLNDLINNGLKVQGGERIGKTIIFASNHLHAKLIVERFQLLYPSFGSDLCVLVDNYVVYAHDLIDRFEIRDKDPQIAVSVDMLDTGIDVPDVLNLVFFKVVKSKIKFMQMIGRGTRLSPNVFGPGIDKKEFYIFDYCGNFDYFSVFENNAEPQNTVSLTTQLFNLRASMVQALQALTYQEDVFAKELCDNLKLLLMDQVCQLNTHRIDVRRERSFVDKYRVAKSWQFLSKVDVLDLMHHLAPLMTPTTEDEGAKRFDLILLQLELSLLEKTKTDSRYQSKVVRLARLLEAKPTIPQIKEKISTIQAVQTDVFWKNVSLDSLERVRLDLRDLMKFLKGDSNETFTVDIEDEVVALKEFSTIHGVLTYKQRVLEYLSENKENPVLQKIHKLEQLTHNDILQLEAILWKQLGTKSSYDEHVSNSFSGGNVAVFIRSMIGIDRSVAMLKFSEFLSLNELNSKQQEYLNTILTYVSENGDITSSTIINDSPFDRFDWSVFGEHVSGVSKFVETVHQVVSAC